MNLFHINIYIYNLIATPCFYISIATTGTAAKGTAANLDSMEFGIRYTLL